MIDQKKQAIKIVKELENIKYTIIQLINDVVFKIEKMISGPMFEGKTMWGL